MIYVDDFQFEATVGRTKGKWSHLVAIPADDPELIGFAVGIGLHPTWIQKPGTPETHFDVTDSYRQRAINAGAEPISVLRLIKLRRETV